MTRGSRRPGNDAFSSRNLKIAIGTFVLIERSAGVARGSSTAWVRGNISCDDRPSRARSRARLCCAARRGAYGARFARHCDPREGDARDAEAEGAARVARDSGRREGERAAFEALRGAVRVGEGSQGSGDVETGGQGDEAGLMRAGVSSSVELETALLVVGGATQVINFKGYVAPYDIDVAKRVLRDTRAKKKFAKETELGLALEKLESTIRVAEARNKELKDMEEHKEGRTTGKSAGGGYARVRRDETQLTSVHPKSD